MSVLTAIARLNAVHRGAPVPQGEALTIPRAAAADRMVLVTVRMAGESGPWGFAVGRPDREPLVLTVPEPRDREAVAGMCERLAEVLCAHVGHPGLDPNATPEQLGRRQLWVPGPSHVEMLHLLEYRYRWARRADESRVELLLALARACGFLFRESRRTGQIRVHDASARLRELFAFPTEDVRQAHLGFLLAWLDERGLDACRVAAREAERRSVGITLDPRIERDELERPVGRWRDAKCTTARDEIASVLTRELRRRFALTVRAIELVDADPRGENGGLAQLAALGREELDGQYLRLERLYAAAGDDEDERPFVVDPETDHHPSAAAARFFANAYSAELTATALAHHDASRIQAMEVAGDAVRGAITDVADEGVGRARVPVWTLESRSALPLRLREGSKVALAGSPSRNGVVRCIEVEASVRRLEIEIVGGKTTRSLPHLPDPIDARAMVGTEVAFVATSMHELTRKKSFQSWSHDTPGAWLTHAAPQPAPVARDGCQPNVLSFVRTLEGP